LSKVEGPKIRKESPVQVQDSTFWGMAEWVPSQRNGKGYRPIQDPTKEMKILSNSFFESNSYLNSNIYNKVCSGTFVFLEV
jgi:hypothetical protein